MDFFFGNKNGTNKDANINPANTGEYAAEAFDRNFFSEPSKERAVKVWITPSIASLWLSTRNQQNREISVDKVRKFSDLIKSGKFVATNQGIGFDIHGVITDGQHRLSAISKAERGVWAWVFTGQPPESRKYVDVPGFGVRSPKDILAMYESFRTPQIASRAIMAIRRWVHLDTRAIPDLVLEVAKTYRRGIVWVCEESGGGKLSTSPVLGATALAYMKEPAAVSEVYRSLKNSRSLIMGSPAYAFLSFVSKTRLNSQSSGEIFNKMLNAYYLQVVGANCMLLKESKEAFTYFTAGANDGAR